MFTFYGLRSLRKCLVDLHCYNMINIANDSHGHLFSFKHDSCLLMIFVILLLCLKLMIYVESTQQLRANNLNFSICRMLESIIKDKIMVHFDTNHLFYEQQHGFHPSPRMSCVTQLLHTMEHWTKSLDDGNDVDIIYLDFCKAFVCVLHQHLLSKLKAYGIYKASNS